MEIITVANNKGGVGKTMQCFQLAAHLANKNCRVLVIDMDSQANLSSTFGIHIARTYIPEWLIGDIPADQIVMPVAAPPSLTEQISIIPSSRHLANFSKLLILSEAELRKNSTRKELLLKQCIAEAHFDYDYIIIDTPPMLGDELIMSIVAADRILIPTQTQDFSMDGLEELLDTLEIIKSRENPHMQFTIIPSMVNLRRNIEKQRLNELSQSFPITPPIRNLVQMQESIATKTPISMMSASSNGHKDYEALWQFLQL